MDRDLRSRIDRITTEVAEAAIRSGRNAHAVTLVGVSKTVGREMVDAAYTAGLRHFGENRVQDAAVKFESPLPNDASLHMIGQLQTNKANIAAKLFQQIESVDRASLISELQKLGAKLERRIPILLQVNIAGEEQKAGCELGDVESLADSIANCSHLNLSGLMTIAPLVVDAEDARPIFRSLRELRDRLVERTPALSLNVLSMGMSNDFGVAIEEGATQVRVGRAIFAG